MTESLRAGDVLSYSAGSAVSDPFAFRKLNQNNTQDFLAVSQKVPALQEFMQLGCPIVINLYPANVGGFDFGVFVDSYMKVETVSRALSLAHIESKPVMMISQPLFLAECLVSHIQFGGQLPSSMVCIVGGYPMPRSLEKVLKKLCKAQQCDVFFIHAYGVAEVEAASCLAVSRDAEGNLLYFPRSDRIQVELKGTSLYLGNELRQSFKTGDHAKQTGEGLIIWNDASRLDARVLLELEQWGEAEWVRRTGYVSMQNGFECQLRKHTVVNHQSETDFYDFAKTQHSDWLTKPVWR